MKKVIILLVFLILGISFVAYGELIKIEQQKFKVTYEIVYNELTLEEAAQKEIAIKEQNHRACSVKVSLREKSDSDITLDDNPIIWEEVIYE